MLNFEYHNPTIIYFGKGQVAVLEEELAKRAKKVLIVTGQGSVKKNGIFDQVLEQIKRAGVSFIELSGIEANPRLKSVYTGIELARKENVDFILAVGGGSVIDAAKTIAVGVEYEGDVWDFFENDIKPTSALPLGTVLTLAATGSEMNPNAVITRLDTKRKLALSTPFMRPVFSILDPEYTFTVNKYHTAAGIADVMAHVFEYYLSPIPHTELQDTLSEALLKTCVQSGPITCEKPHDYNARSNIMWASTLALNGLIGRGKISDWVCHAIEHEVSAISDISHGAGLAVLLPGFMKVVYQKYGVKKFCKYGTNVWGIGKNKNDTVVAEESIEKTKEFFTSLGLPSKLSELDISSEHFETITDNVIKRRPELEHFKQLSQEEIQRVLELSI